jgi:hypothetical protein
MAVCGWKPDMMGQPQLVSKHRQDVRSLAASLVRKP